MHDLVIRNASAARRPGLAAAVAATWRVKDGKIVEIGKDPRKTESRPSTPTASR